jgi:hypothetical protein
MLLLGLDARSLLIESFPDDFLQLQHLIFEVLAHRV